MLVHDRRGVFRAHVAIPDCLGINHHRRSVFALIQAPGFVYSNRVSQTGGLCQLLQLREQFTLTIGRARWARSTFRANVMTYEDVVLEWRQKILLLFPDYSVDLTRKVSTIHRLGPPPSERMFA